MGHGAGILTLTYDAIYSSSPRWPQSSTFDWTSSIELGSLLKCSRAIIEMADATASDSDDELSSFLAGEPLLRGHAFDALLGRAFPAAH